MPAAAIRGRSGEVWINSGSATTLTKVACDQIGATTIYHVTDAAHRQLDPATTPSVYIDDVLQSTGYHMHAPAGEIHFDGAPGGTVTLSGKYYASSEVSLVQSWEMSLTSEAVDVTGLGDTARTYVGLGITSWSGTISRLHENNTWVAKVQANATQIIVKLYEDEPNDRVWIGYGVITSVPVTTPVEGLDTETITFTGVGLPYYVTDET